MAHHGRARDLAKRADVGQAGGSVAGLEDHGLVHATLELVKTRNQATGLFEGPGFGVVEGADKRGLELKCHCWASFMRIGAGAKSRGPGDAVAGTLEQDRP